MVAQGNTLFVKQGTTLNRSIGPHFKIPPACLQAFITWTKNPRGITLLQRLGIGFVSHIIMTIVTSLTEHQRLQAVKAHGLESGGEVPITIFILLPQFVLLGVSETLVAVATTQFFYGQAPETMKSLGTSYSYTSFGMGNFLSTFLLSTVTHITKKNGHKGWILNNLNEAHLDYYDAFFTILNLLNFFVFLILAQLYVYKTENTELIQQ
ncbi:putative proton-dependent oligopeptide transporter family, MFS transporter superfamily [Dioscorea sansibarensis]